jgi:hypothetical protein
MDDISCQIAFKEWAAICEALAAGRQTIILRKGGIAEGRDGFRVQHREFLLYPTNFHQAAENLSADAEEFIKRAIAGTKPGSGAPQTDIAPAINLQLFAQVHEVYELPSEAAALRLAGQHIWSEATVRQRFAYKRPGLFLLVVRVFALPQPVAVKETPAMAGCKSWVDLPTAVATENIVPVLTDDQFASQLARVHSALA